MIQEEKYVYTTAALLPIFNLHYFLSLLFFISSKAALSACKSKAFTINSQLLEKKNHTNDFYQKGIKKSVEG